jgi:zinc protease
MSQKNKCIAVLAVLFLFSAVFGFAEKTPVENLYQYKLDNGLTLFAAENHAVPLVYIEIAVRAGGVTQTPETAGLFHLYEHMMFKGNSLYPDAASVQRALSDMGVANWNGSTGIDCVNYFFTVPSGQLENGLAFWSAAIRTPLMKENELENEKKVVLSEIQGNEADPARIYNSSVSRLMFPDAPCRVDPAGSVPVVQNATVAQLRAIQQQYYIPCNAALFVGGDINPDDVYKLVKKIYGSWDNGGRSLPEKRVQQNTAPFTSNQYRVMPYDQISPQIVQVLISFRGPDADYNLKDTYTADMLGDFMQEPDGTYKQTLVNNSSLGIPSTDYVWGGYTTERANGSVDFGAVFLSPEKHVTERVSLFLTEIQNKILPGMAVEKSLYSAEKKNYILKGIKDQHVYEAETASGLLSNIRFWWVCTGADYYFSYEKNMAKVEQQDEAAFISKYITGKNALVTVLVNPKVYEQTKRQFTDAGYIEITADSAFWWKDAGNKGAGK